VAATPAVVLAKPGGGVQLIAARGSDARLLAFAASLGER
jgi:Asp-tRNA(Asn)/Glu-tRNA(Gln) amidotransferase A subunit family amidase